MVTNEQRAAIQRTGRRTDADACSLRHTEGEQGGGAAGRTRAFLETTRASSKPCTESYGARNRERSVRKQLGSTLSSQREILSSSSSSSFYRSRTSRSALNAYLPYLTLFDPPRYLIRPYYSLALTCVKSRFPRLGAPIPSLDGFLHDTVQAVVTNRRAMHMPEQSAMDSAVNMLDTSTRPCIRPSTRPCIRPTRALGRAYA